MNYKVYTADSTRSFVMEAPMMVISAAFNMHRDATHRVVRELETEVAADVCFNGRPTFLNINRIVITR